jgi:hypothetical protein
VTDEQGTIDAFTGDGSGDDEDPDDTNPVSDVTGGSTYRWDPEGAPCDDCGAVVERRWRAAAGLVCPDCKWG